MVRRRGKVAGLFRAQDANHSLGYGSIITPPPTHANPPAGSMMSAESSRILADMAPMQVQSLIARRELVLASGNLLADQRSVSNWDLIWNLRASASVGFGRGGGDRIHIPIY
jgi:hypothetical protein